jgi:hypothetical protein
MIVTVYYHDSDMDRDCALTRMMISCSTPAAAR